MKLVLYDDYRMGVLQGQEVVDVTAAVRYLRDHPRGQRMNDVIARWGEFKGKIEAAAKTGSRRPISQVRFRPPVPKPSKILCMGVNYMEERRPQLPGLNAFVKSDVISGDGDTITLPPFEARTAQPEPELGLVISRLARHIKAADAMGYVFGYMNFVDFSLRITEQPGPSRPIGSKSSEGFAPIGPALVTADEVPNPHNLDVKLTVNGHTTGYNTSTMGHRIAESIEWLSTVCTLYPGDIISMGVNHVALQATMHGDDASMEIFGLGPPLHIHVKDSIPTRKFPREQH
ncbi:MAG: fumarylacetoacetate hydrolase family protein [Chloroflexota bacterium]